MSRFHVSFAICKYSRVWHSASSSSVAGSRFHLSQPLQQSCAPQPVDHRIESLRPLRMIGPCQVLTINRIG